MLAGAEATQHEDSPIIFSGTDCRINVYYRYETDAFVEVSVWGVIWKAQPLLDPEQVHGRTRGPGSYCK
jgi:hypothetical protein